MGSGRVDMGESFPLRFSQRTEAGAIVPCLLLATLFLVLPLAYAADTGTWNSPLLYFFLAVGGGAAFLAVVAARTRIRIVIDATTVRWESRRLLRTSVTGVPRSEYPSLRATTSQEPGFVAPRPVFRVVLWHPDAPKSVLLFETHKRDVFDARLAGYERLFDLRADPE